MSSEFALVLVLLLLSSVFSAVEIATMSVRKTRIAELVEGGSSGALGAVAARRSRAPPPTPRRRTVATDHLRRPVQPSSQTP